MIPASHSHPTADAADGQRFALVGGRLALDFANTASWDGADLREERLAGAEALVAWLLLVRVIDRQDEAELLRLAAESPAATGALLERARRLRAVIRATLARVARGTPMARDDLEPFNAELASLLPLARLCAAGEGDEAAAVWSTATGAQWTRVLVPVVWSAAAILTSAEDTARLRECAGARCGWLFVDESRNHSRRWCTMRDCGNRAKASRYYARRRGGR